MTDATSPPPRLLPRSIAIAAAGLLLATFVLRGEDSLRRESPTWDETMHLDYGLNFLRLGPSVPPRDHPYPVTALLALPLAVATPDEGQVAARGPLPDGGGVAELRKVENPRNLWPARRMNLMLAAAGLALAGWWIGRRAGTGIGLAFLAAGTLDPGFLAPARYVTTDAALGLALLAGTLAAWRHRETGSIGSLVAAGVACGVGLTAKFSAVLLVPGVFLAMLPGAAPGDPAAAGKGVTGPFACVPPTWTGRLRRAVIAATVAGAVGAAVYLAVFHVHALLGLAPWGAGMEHLARAMKDFVRIRSEARGTFLLGGFFEGGTPLYFPVLLAAKTPLAMLVLAPLPFALPEGRSALRRYAPFFAVPVVYLAASIASGVNLGHRHLAPVLPALWLLAAIGTVTLAGRVRRGTAVAVAAVGVLALEGALAHPHYLPFQNALFGGIDCAWRVAVDSATDWGQDLPALKAWADAEAPGQPLHLAYFGTADPAAYGLQTVWRPCKPLGRPRPGRDAPAAPCRAGAPVLAVSATCLQGAAGGATRDNCWAWLRDRTPDAIVGGSILVYRDVPDPP